MSSRLHKTRITTSVCVICDVEFTYERYGKFRKVCPSEACQKRQHADRQRKLYAKNREAQNARRRELAARPEAKAVKAANRPPAHVEIERLNEWKRKYPHHARKRWITRERRLRLYERDGYACHICGGLTDKGDHSFNENGVFVTGPTYPSLDHIIRVRDGGSHDDNNLKTAHYRCNAIRG